MKVRADDGAVLRVNGKVIDTRRRMTDGNITHTTRETRQGVLGLPGHRPRGLLTRAASIIGVEEHLSYKGTPSMTFDLNPQTLAK